MGDVYCECTWDGGLPSVACGDDQGVLSGLEGRHAACEALLPLDRDVFEGLIAEGGSGLTVEAVSSDGQDRARYAARWLDAVNARR